LSELEYLGLYGKNSQEIFLNRIISFLRVHYPEKAVINGKEKYAVNTNSVGEYAKRYFSENRNYKRDVNQFLIAIRDAAPISRRNMLATVRKFFEQNEHELPSIFWKNLMGTITGEVITQDKIPTNAQLKQLLMNMPIPGRALYSTLASSGMRIGEGMALKDSDIDLNSNPARINIPASITKTKRGRTVFISSESKGFIQEWLKVRTNSDRLFSFSKIEGGTFWRNAVKQCGLDQRDSTTGRLLYHPHSLRKLFRTRGGKINRDATDILLGHKGLANDQSYLRLEETDLIEFYAKLESTITVFSDLEVRQSDIKKIEFYEQKFSNLERIVNQIAAMIGIPV
jgi:integrase